MDTIAPGTAPDKTDHRTLFTLKTKGAMTAHHLSEKLGISVVAARKQLSRLADDGLVQFQEEVRGPGRPERVWRLSAKGHGRFPDSHSELTLEMISSIRRIFGEEGLNRLIAEREKTALAGYRSALEHVENLKGRVTELAHQREREGYMAEIEELEDGALLLVENHCPICAAATACQGFCRSELNIFRTVLGPDVQVTRTDHLMAGARRCAYRIEAAGKERNAG